MSNAVYWFTNDLRIEDNPALIRALQTENTLHCLYCLDPRTLKPGRYSTKPIGEKRLSFLLQSLAELDETLRVHGQHLHVYLENPDDLFCRLYQQYSVRRVHHSVNAGLYEKAFFSRVSQRPDVVLNASHSHTLFNLETLPFDLCDLPETFSKFRKLVEKEKRRLVAPMLPPTSWPEPLCVNSSEWKAQLETNTGSEAFSGGYKSALRHLDSYFSTDNASHYKETRNALDDWSSSTKFSPWLANGSLSPNRVLWLLKQYESTSGANDSTYWIEFELLWREYFQWYAHKHGAHLFRFEGIRGQKPLTTFYPSRFKQWCQGETSFPIVNACMKQLNDTGYMSNRGRQLVASCLVHELQLDWRYGAAYFEQQLVDYDVASNWGNWQYLAGVGADPRGNRQFNLEKQTLMYDPNREFIHRWNGEAGTELSGESVDYVDWSIMPSVNEKA
ncbi:DASH family cryptochrome [Vibrio nigripulchritudo]|uniref:DASH family cryptochrome n=1 Tax=Vibrio nigripulchritudo TaxID=28173 RepID=UPI0005F9B027|nr:DASH family cryptochrome [Vibrio nigripulchritudo]